MLSDTFSWCTTYDTHVYIYVSTEICFEDVRAPVTTTATMMTTVWPSLLQSEQDDCVFCRSQQVTMSMRMKV